ncbi:hypothetical protein [Saccharopolyspora phatthalungensis]|uniref:Uncharacterized protein n=1 Tax=Saccharopolyspora phatthalungensis TaxID=664693 RepID=A0A840QHM2_9PSEU|nr:hypothetical protein [Saccharopolyspora phatthalungensis]MBB5156773.1 hypothetical protein [Saccharopolyspora phatthalungensis]
MSNTKEKLNALILNLAKVQEHAQHLHWVYERARQEVAELMCEVPAANTVASNALLAHLEDGSRAGLELMVIRHHRERSRVLHTPSDAVAHTRTTSAPPNPWENNRVVWFLAHFTGLPNGTRFGMRFDPDTRRPTAGTITAPDGSYASVMLEPTPDGTWSVTESGPTPLWTAVEKAHQLWQAAGEPGWSRLGVTVEADDQWVWIDEPHGEHQWKLTL